MPKRKVKIESKFPAVKDAAHDLVRHARDRALDAGEHEAEKRLERVDDTKGYELPIDVDQRKTGFQSGLIEYAPWYGRFFEYGTVSIAAVPFMRPAHRKMRKEFVGTLGDEFEGWVKRRARVSRR